MIRHLFKLMWNRKGKNFLLLVEVLASFMVLFGIMTLVVKNYRNYAQPLGFEYENVWVIETTIDVENEEAVETMKNLKSVLRNQPEIESLALMTDNFPFAFSSSTNSFDYKEEPLTSNSFWVEPEFFDVLRIPIERGKVFDEANINDEGHYVVVNRKLEETILDIDPSVDIVGEDIDDAGDRIVTGVIDRFRYASQFMSNQNSFFRMYSLNDTNQYFLATAMLVRVKPDAGKEFEQKLMNLLERTNPAWEYDISWLSEMKTGRDLLVMVPVIIFSIIGAFLLFNVGMGIFGVLWYNINRRRPEIGLRRALGAPAGAIGSQFIGEVMVITTFSVILGLLIAIQFPLMGAFDLPAQDYFVAMGIALGIIYLITFLCAWYPSHQAARIEPAQALHEE
ncbi:FtsX-like permease family protein [Cryomorphaceae bacterium]|nr:FtsX-like permease family protein [Cryomorphaceae bacterium]